MKWSFPLSVSSINFNCSHEQCLKILLIKESNSLAGWSCSFKIFSFCFILKKNLWWNYSNWPILETLAIRYYIVYTIFFHCTHPVLIYFWKFKLRRLKKGGAYFKVRGIIQMKIQNLVIFFFQITITNYDYHKWFYIFHNY